MTIDSSAQYMSRTELEALIDKQGIRQLLFDIATICDKKAEHVLGTWQDAKLSKTWAELGNRLEQASNWVGEV